MARAAAAEGFRGELDVDVSPARQDPIEAVEIGDFERHVVHADVLMAVEGNRSAAVFHLPERDHHGTVAVEAGRVLGNLSDLLKAKCFEQKGTGGIDIRYRESGVVESLSYRVAVGHRLDSLCCLLGFNAVHSRELHFIDIWSFSDITYSYYGVIVDKLMAMRTYVEICERGSLTAAAEALGKSQPTVVRVLANLEQELGVRLLRRTTRRMTQTSEGSDYLARCRQILDDISAAERALTASDSTPRGQLRITAPITFGQRHIGPLSIEFQQQYPQVQLELLLLDRVVNLLEEGLDLAVRIGPLADSTMIARNIGEMRRVLVASPALLSRSGYPSHPEDLAEHPAVFFRHSQRQQQWQFQQGDTTQQVTVTGVYSSNQAVPAVDACVAGLGFGRFLHYQVADQMEKGELEILLPTWEPVADPVSLVYSDARLMTPSLRVLIEFYQQRLSAQLNQLPG